MEHCGASLQSVYRESIVGFCWVMCFVDFLTLKFRKVQQQEQQQQQQQAEQEQEEQQQFGDLSGFMCFTVMDWKHEDGHIC